MTLVHAKTIAALDKRTKFVDECGVIEHSCHSGTFSYASGGRQGANLTASSASDRIWSMSRTVCLAFGAWNPLSPLGYTRPQTPISFPSLLG
ncbi:hypothetical protein E9536_39760 [Burkholderia sp. LS-044]|uniref:hypothetical protein n=1 Tax=Burkholderia sp. LS-044 TaxID=1459967 RepID=UPI0010A5DCF5|nr:hypothetical protein [Burkholderia sp. LS-044]THJ46777.1 hypothetical protein E9536_39760 [Burkholderia sp. LS-044]